MEKMQMILILQNEMNKHNNFLLLLLNHMEMKSARKQL